MNNKFEIYLETISDIETIAFVKEGKVVYTYPENSHFNVSYANVEVDYETIEVTKDIIILKFNINNKNNYILVRGDEFYILPKYQEEVIFIPGGKIDGHQYIIQKNLQDSIVGIHLLHDNEIYSWVGGELPTNIGMTYSITLTSPTDGFVKASLVSSRLYDTGDEFEGVPVHWEMTKIKYVKKSFRTKHSVYKNALNIYLDYHSGHGYDSQLVFVEDLGICRLWVTPHKWGVNPVFTYQKNPLIDIDDIKIASGYKSGGIDIIAIRPFVTELSNEDDILNALRHMGISIKRFTATHITQPREGILLWEEDENGDTIRSGLVNSVSDILYLPNEKYGRIYYDHSSVDTKATMYHNTYTGEKEGWFDTRHKALILVNDGKIHAIAFTNKIIGNKNVLVSNGKSYWTNIQDDIRLEKTNIIYRDSNGIYYTVIDHTYYSFDPKTGESNILPKDHKMTRYLSDRAIYLLLESSEQPIRLNNELKVYAHLMELDTDNSKMAYCVINDDGTAIMSIFDSDTLLSKNQILDRVLESKSLKGIEYKIVISEQMKYKDVNTQLAIVYKDGYEYEFTFNGKEPSNQDILQALKQIKLKKDSEKLSTIKDKLKTKKAIIEILKQIPQDTVLTPKDSTSLGNCAFGTANFLNKIFDTDKFKESDIENNIGKITIQELLKAVNKAKAETVLNGYFKTVVSALAVQYDITVG
jgi:hypothetical protein